MWSRIIGYYMVFNSVLIFLEYYNDLLYVMNLLSGNFVVNAHAIMFIFIYMISIALVVTHFLAISADIELTVI